MNLFSIDPIEQQNQDAAATLNPAPRNKLPAEWYEGIGTGLSSGVQTGYQRFKYSLATDLNNTELQQQSAARMKELVPDPMTVGAVGQFVNGFADQMLTYGLAVGENFPAVSPNVAVAEGTKIYQRSQEALNLAKGMDAKTAADVARTEATSFGVGMVLPAAAPGGLLTRMATGAGINLVQGQVANMAIYDTLNKAGYREMAEQYRPFEGTSMLTDMAIGGVFGGLLGPRARVHAPETAPRERPTVAPSDLAATMAMDNAAHVELGTAPGIPADAEARTAHVNAINEAIQSLMEGRPVEVGPEITQANLVENPQAVETRRGIVEGVEEHLGPEWVQLRQELESRNLPGDTTLYSITPMGWGNTNWTERPPVRTTAEVRGILDRARAEGWDADRILGELEGLKGKLERRNAANAEAGGDRVRGELWVRERLTRAERNGEINPETRRLAEWLIDKNPNLVEDIGLSFNGVGRREGAAGGYDPVSRIVTIIKNRANDETAIHEILHHAERMMPEEVQAGIQAAWRAEIKAIREWATRTQNETMMRATSDAINSALGDEQAFARLADMVAHGEVDERFYAMANPSEFWAVNGSRILAARASESWVQRAKQWLTELFEKFKDVLGLRSDAAVLRGLDDVLKGTGEFQSPNMLANRKIPALQVRAKSGVEAPGAGVAKENLNGFEPDLRVKVPGKMTLPAKPLVLTGTNLKNAARQIANIDDILARFPDADKSPLEWSRMMAYAMATNDVPIPPYRFLSEINSDGALKNLSRLTKGQIDDANHGFENARLFREAYLDGTMGVEDTGKLFMWSFLSRGVSPYVQEGLFIDAFPGVDKWIKKAAAGELTQADFPAYEAWAKSVAPQGSGQPGSGATHNLNAFGKLFLFKMGAKGEDGVSLLQHMHNMMTDPNMTGKELRRWFISNTEGVGIDNKVVSFTMLVAGFPDVMVLDRVQIRQLWDDGRFAGRNLYDGRKVDGKPVAGSALSEITYGARGLLIYEAIERALQKRIENIYTSLGRPQDASVGRYHWETWVADSQQEASHGTLDAILANAQGNDAALSGITAKEGEYGGYAYGARYGRDAQGKPYFLYTTPLGNEYRFSVGGFREFMDAVKSPSNKVVPSKFKVTEAGNAPWYEKAEVNRQALDALASRYAGGADEGGQGASAVRASGQGEAVPNGAGRDPFAAESLVAQRPDLTYIQADGTMIAAGRALLDADAEIARAEQDSQGYGAAVACALRG